MKNWKKVFVCILALFVVFAMMPANNMLAFNVEEETGTGSEVTRDVDDQAADEGLQSEDQAAQNEDAGEQQETPSASEQETGDSGDQSTAPSSQEGDREESLTIDDDGSGEEGNGSATSEEEEKPDEDKEDMPAVVFTGKAGGVNVTVDAGEGAFPEGTVMKVTSVSSSQIMDAVEDAVEGDVDKVKAVDITFYDKEGNEVKPEKEISVKLTTSGMDKAAAHDVLHIDDNGQADIVEEARSNGNRTTFETKEFSIYAIVETGERARLTVDFYNGSENVASVTVNETDLDKIDEIIYDPGAGKLENGETFRGWYIGESDDYTGATRAKTIQQIRDEISGMLQEGVTDGTTVSVHAMIFRKYTVIYQDEAGVTIKSDTALFRAGDESADYKVSLSYTPKDQDAEFQGWQVIEGESATNKIFKNNEVIKGIDRDYTLRAYAPAGFWITFNENGAGASYTAPQFVKTGNTTVEPSNAPTRYGYTFKGWYTDKDCSDGNKFTFGKKLDSRITLYAKWEAEKTANYTIIIWKQNVAGDGYDFDRSITLSGNVGSKVSTVSAKGSGDSRYAVINGKNYNTFTGFHLKSFDEDVTITTEGNAIVDVYYDRNLITLNFYTFGGDYKKSTSTSSGTYYIPDGNGGYVSQYLYYNGGKWYKTRKSKGWGSYTYSDEYVGDRYTADSSWNIYKTMSGLYGSTLSDNGFAWPTEYNWYDGHDSNTSATITTSKYGRTTFLDAFLPSDGSSTIDFYGKATEAATCYVYFYKQNANGNGYTLANTIGTSGNVSFSITDKYSGFVADHYSVDDGEDVQLGEKGSDGYYAKSVGFSQSLRIYFNRAVYNIGFMDGVYVDGNDKAIDGIAGRGQLGEKTDIPYGRDITEEGKFKPEARAGFVFEGWYTDDSCTKKYDFRTMPAGGVSVYAKWKQKQYRVFLHPNVPASDTSLVWGDVFQSTSFRVNYGERLSEGKTITGERTNYELIGWYTDQACTSPFDFESFVLNDTTVTSEYDRSRSTETDSYGEVTEQINKDQTGDRFWIERSLDLYAKWRSKLDGAEGISLAYVATSDGTDAPKDTGFYLDQSEAIAGAAATYTGDDDKAFKYWIILDKDGNETEKHVYPGQSFIVDINDAVKKAIEGSSASDKIRNTYTVTLKAHYGKADAGEATSIKFDANGGTFADGVKSEYKDLAINQDINILTADDVSRDGYVFKGWSFTPGDNNETDIDPATAPKIAADNFSVSDKNTDKNTLYAVWQRDLKITVKDRTVSYNGGSQEGFGITNVTGTEGTVDTEGYTVEGLVRGDVLTVKGYDRADGAAAGRYDNGSFEGAVITITRNGEEVTRSYETTLTPGALIIKKIPVTITAGSDRKMYDGTALVNDSYTNTALAEGDVIESVTIVGSQTETGTGENIPSAARIVNTSGENVTDSYDITYKNGKLTVFSRAITITAASGSWVYDGKAHSETGVSVSGGQLLDGDVLEARAEGQVTDVADTQEGNNPVAPGYRIMRGSVDVTADYEITTAAGTLTIEPAEVTVRAQDKGFSYNGTAQTWNKFDVEGLAGSDAIDAIVTGSVTFPGEEADNKVDKYTFTSGNENNYKVTVENGKLSMKDATEEITITAADGSWKYDGKTHKNDEVTLTGGKLFEGDKLVASAEGSVKNVSDTAEGNNTVKEYKIMHGDRDVTSSYHVTKKAGTLTVTPREVTLTSESDSKKYDGKALTRPDVEISGDGFVDDEVSDVKAEGSITKTGSVVNTITFKEKEDFEAGNYNVTRVEGTLTVTKRSDDIVIAAPNAEKDYDGKVLKAEEASVSGLPEGYTIDVTVKGSAKNVSDTAEGNNKVESYVIKKDGEDVTDQFDEAKIIVRDGTLTINKKNIELTSESAEKPYDGKALTRPDVTVNGVFAEGEVTSVTAKGSVTSVSEGKVKNTISVETAEGFDEGNYTITKKEGTLQITANNTPITVTAASAQKLYDGKELSKPEAKVEGLPDGFTYEATVTGSVTAVSEGTVKNKVDSFIIKNEAGEDVTDQFSNITVKDGSLSIKKRKVVLSTESGSKVYDGTALTKPGVTMSGDGFMESEMTSVSASGSVTNVSEGKVKNKIEFKEGTGFISGNYDIQINEGTLEIEKRPVTITAESKNFTYSGKAQKCGEFKAEGLVDGESVEAEVKGEITYPSQSPVVNKLDSYKFTSGDKENYEVTVKDGKLTMDKASAAVTITAESKSWVYDGKTHKAPGVTVTEGELFPGDKLVAEATGSVTDTADTYEGNNPVDPEYRIMNGEEDVTDNYVITAKAGTLSVTDSREEITVKTAGGRYVYDGKSHGAEVTVSSLPEGYTLEKAESTAKAKNVADGKVTATADQLIIRNAAGKDVTKNLNIKYIDGAIEITPAELTVVTPSADKVYDGEALTAKGSISGFVADETADFRTTGSRTEVGESDNTYAIDWNGTADRSNYTVTEQIGKLVVTESKDEIVVTTTGGVFTYDGKSHGDEVSVSGLPKGYKVKEAASSAKAKNVTDEPVKATADKLVIVNAKGDDVTARLSITYADGTIEVEPATLYVVTPSAEKTYDGKALTAKGTVTGFVEGESAEFTTTGTQTDVGSSDNTYALEWSGSVKKSNYRISENIGTLTVRESEEVITVTTTGGTYTYDGKAHGASVSVSSLPEGYTLSEAASGAEVKDVSDGEVKATADTLVIMNAAGKDVTSALKIKYVDDVLAVTPAELTITTPSESKVYDGDALTAEGSIEGFVNNETAEFVTTGTQTETGSSVNSYSLKWNGTAKESNYRLNEVLGTLTVTESEEEIVVTTTGGTFVYDGTAHKAEVTVSQLPKGYKVETAESDASAKNVTDKPVSATADKLVIKNAAGKDVTDKLKIHYVDGEITVLPAELTITTPDASKVYDGEALKAAGSISGFVAGETAEFRTTGSRTDVGESENGYSLEWNGTAKESNYRINETVGKLTVTENTEEITATAAGGEYTYDGKNHRAEVTVSTLPKGYSLDKAESTAKAKNVADGKVTATADQLIIRNAAGKDVTKDLNIKYVNGTIEIVPAELKVVTPSADKIYDGEALTAEGSISGFVAGETADFETTGSRTETGSSKNTYSLEWNGTAVETNYRITEDLGTLTVTENADEIVVTATGGKYTYDGKPHRAEITVSRLPKGYTIESAESETAVTDVTEEPVAVTADNLVIKNAKGEDVTSKLNVRYVDGKISVVPAELTVTTLSAEKEYDGEELTAKGSVSGLVGDETVSFMVTGSQTDTGESENSYQLQWNGSAKIGNYTVTENLGTLKVTESTRQITVTTEGGAFVYDGKNHKASVTVDGVPKGYTVDKASSDAAVKDATKEPVKATADTLIIRNAAGKDVTAGLNIKYVDGSITVSPAQLTVNTPSKVKTYDGEALTAEGSISGFVTGETADFRTTGSQTEVGESENTYSLRWTGTAKKDNYVISESLGRLAVTESADEIVVTTTGGTFVYDGKTHGAKVSVNGLPKGYTVERAASTAKVKDVADGTVTATADVLVIRNKSGKDVTDKLNIHYIDGKITVNPAPLAVSTPDAEKTYDGEALRAEGSLTGLVNGETAVFKTTGSRTDVGESKNTYSLKWNGTARKSNYALTETVGTLKVKENTDEITAVTTGGVFTYDGKSHGAEVAVSTLPKGYSLDKTESTAKAKNVTDEPVAATADGLIIRNAAGKDVTSKLNIKYVDGSITVVPASLVINTESAIKVYDGDALTAKGSISGFVTGETADFETTGSQTDVGESENTYSLRWNGTAKEKNYVISETIGRLAVTENEDEILVTTTGGTFTYDGKSHGAEVAVSGIPKGYKLAEASSKASAKNVTEKPVKATADKLVIVNKSGKDVTDKLKLRYVDGEISVTPALLTITTPDASKTYDGEALTAEGSISGFVAGETADFKTTGSQTDVGESENTYSLTWDGTAKESNYRVAATTGKLSVSESKEQITVTTEGGKYVYDGKAHEARVTVSKLPKGYTLKEAASDTALTDAVDSPVPVTADRLVITNAAGADVTSRLNVVYEDGSLMIEPATLTVVTPDADKVYNGKPLTAEGSISGFVAGETATFTTTGSQTDVGDSRNTYSLEWNGTAKEKNYRIEEHIGALTVRESEDEIIVVTTGGKYTYDGKAHGASVAVKGIPEGYTLERAASTAEAVNVTKEPVSATADVLTIRNAAGADVTSKLNIHFTDDVIQIEPAALTVITQDGSKVYDGKALRADGSVSGFAPGETAAFKVTGSQTKVGKSVNTYEIDWTGENAEDRSDSGMKQAEKDNYTISETLGTLEVTESTEEITVTTTGGEYTYDGKAHGAGVTVSKLPEGYELDKASSDAKATDVSEEAVTAKADTLIIRNAEGEDVTDRLNINRVNGKIVILPAELTVETPDATKVYDGDALTAKGSISGFVNGETAEFRTTGSQTKTGDSVNTYEIRWNGTAKEKNYFITEKLGRLVVTENADEILVTTEGGTFTYDGKAHGATVTVSGVPKGYYLEKAASSASATDVTEEDVTAKADTFVIRNSEGEDVTKELTIRYVDGMIRILPAEIIVNTPDAEKVYDGSELAAEGSVSGFENGETASFDTTGSQTDAGSSENSYSLQWDGTANESNYTVKDTTGTLNVDKRNVKVDITGDRKIVQYDGYRHSAHGYTVAISDELYEEKDFTFSGKAAASRTEEGTVQMGLSVKQFANINDNFKASFRVADGYVTVLPIDETVPSDGSGESNIGRPEDDQQAGRNDSGNGTAGDGSMLIGLSEVPQNTPPLSIIEPVEDNGPVVIDDNTTPFADNDAWALFNLILAVIAVVMSIYMLIVFRRRKDEEDQAAGYGNADRTGNGEENDGRGSRRFRFISIIPAVCAVVAFILTEDMTKVMQLNDKWTPLMAVITIVQMVVFLLCQGRNDDDKKDEKAAANQR